MITQELKAKWIVALRSGEYRQGIGQLRSAEGFCCLGVLCQVAGIPISPNGKSASTDDNEDCPYEPLYAVGVPIEWTSQLWSMNDNRKPFREIADFIEKNLPTVSPSAGE